MPESVLPTELIILVIPFAATARHSTAAHIQMGPSYTHRVLTLPPGTSKTQMDVLN